MMSAPVVTGKGA